MEPSTDRYQVVFVDVLDSIIEQLQKTKEYTVTEIGGEGEKVNKISNYRAFNSKTHEADVVKELETAEIVSSLSSQLDCRQQSLSLSSPRSLVLLAPIF